MLASGVGGSSQPWLPPPPQLTLLFLPRTLSQGIDTEGGESKVTAFRQARDVCVIGRRI